MPNVTNADLLRQLTSLQEEFKRTANENAVNYKNLGSKIDGYGDRLVKIEDRLDKIERDNKQKCYVRIKLVACQVSINYASHNKF